MYRKFCEFIKNNISLTIYTFILTFVLYGIKIANCAYGMDSISYISIHDVYLKHWYGIGRFGEVFLKKILWGSYTNIYLINILTFLLFALSSLLLCFIFSQSINVQKFKYHLFIIPTLFLTSSVFVVQFYFVLQNFEFVLGMIFVIISVQLITRSGRKSIRMAMYYIGATVLLFISISIYQTFILFFSGIVASIILLKCFNRFEEQEGYPLKEMLIDVTPFILILVISFICYLTINNLVLDYTGIENQNHSTEMMVWKNLGFKNGMISLIKALLLIIFVPSAPTGHLVYNYGILVSTILMVPVIGMFIIRKNKNILVFLISVITIYIIGFGVIIAAGALTPPPRSMAPQFPYLIAFLFLFTSLFIKKKYIKNCFAILVIFIGCSQFKNSSNLLFSEEMTFQEDQQKVLEINQAVNNLHLENPSDYKIVLIGNSEAKNKFALPVYNEPIGVSMFQFGWSEDIGAYDINVNIIELMDIMGITYEIPTLDEYLNVWKNKTTLKDSSSNIAIEVIENYIIIKID